RRLGESTLADRWRATSTSDRPFECCRASAGQAGNGGLDQTLSCTDGSLWYVAYLEQPTCSSRERGCGAIASSLQRGRGSGSAGASQSRFSQSCDLRSLFTRPHPQSQPQTERTLCPGAGRFAPLTYHATCTLSGSARDREPFQHDPSQRECLFCALPFD